MAGDCERADLGLPYVWLGISRPACRIDNADRSGRRAARTGDSGAAHSCRLLAAALANRAYPVLARRGRDFRDRAFGVRLQDALPRLAAARAMADARRWIAGRNCCRAGRAADARERLHARFATADRCVSVLCLLFRDAQPDFRVRLCRHAAGALRLHAGAAGDSARPDRPADAARCDGCRGCLMRDPARDRGRGLYRTGPPRAGCDARDRPSAARRAGRLLLGQALRWRMGPAGARSPRRLGDGAPRCLCQ